MSLGSGLFTKPTAGKPHIVKNRLDGVAGEVGKLRQDLINELAPMAALAIEEWTNAPAAANNAIKTGIATSTSPQVYKGAALNGAIGAARLAAPRRICVLQAAGAHYVNQNVVVKGLDAQGKFITDVLLLLATGTGNIVATTKFFSQVLELDVPAQADGAGTLTFGVGLAVGGADDGQVGLARPPKARTGALFLQKEIMDGSEISPITGTLQSAVAAPPYGAYTPAAAPNGAHDYSVLYEFDATA